MPIKIDSLTVKFDEKVVIDNYSNTFKDNKVYCILGESGCGKTTLLKSISGLLKPNNGVITYNKQLIHKPINDIFMMHQNYANFPWLSCIKNILLPISIKKKLTEDDFKAAEQMLKKVGLLEYKDKYPSELSGGMNQRLALARVLLSKPNVLLMDEPLSALDPKTRKDMQNLVLEMHKETKNIIILVTHDHDEAHLMGDQIINV